MKPPPLASDAHPGFIRVDGVTILLQSQSDRLHDRFPAIGNLTDAAHYRAGPQPNLPFIANPCANSLDGKPWVTLQIDDAGDNLWPILHRSRHFWGKGGLRLGVAVPKDFSCTVSLQCLPDRSSVHGSLSDPWVGPWQTRATPTEKGCGSQPPAGHCTPKFEKPLCPY